jgi:uncharacterized membrane protein YhaH (DUF805 family)
MKNPGWYDDPEDATQLRWWSGNRWTDRRMPRAKTGYQETPRRESEATAEPDRGRPDTSATSRPAVPRDPWVVKPSRETSPSWGARTGSGAGSTGTGWSPSATSSQGRWPAPPRTFVEAIKVCLTKYVDGKGRASRSEYWYFALFSFIVNIATAGVGGIFLLPASITVGVRRLHDIGKSAWVLLWVFVPVVGTFLLLYYLVKPGEPQMNSWG